MDTIGFTIRQRRFQKMKQQRKRIRKCIAILTTLAMVLSLGAGITLPRKAQAAGYGLSNPVTDSNGVTTWDCVYFGNYPTEYKLMPTPKPVPPSATPKLVTPTPKPVIPLVTPTPKPMTPSVTPKYAGSSTSKKINLILYSGKMYSKRRVLK